MLEYELVGRLNAQQLAALGEKPIPDSVTALFKRNGSTFHLGTEIKGKRGEFLVDEAYPLTKDDIEKLKATPKK